MTADERYAQADPADREALLAALTREHFGTTHRSFQRPLIVPNEPLAVLCTAVYKRRRQKIRP